MIWVPKLVLPRHMRRKQRGFVINPFAFGGGAAPFVVDAADFDGTNDSMLRSGTMTGQTSTKTGIFSGWFKIDTFPVAICNIFKVTDTVGGFTPLAFQVDANNRFQLRGLNTTLRMDQVITSLTTGVWYHVLYSWDLAAGAGAGTRLGYINGVAMSFANSTSADANLTFGNANEYRVGFGNVGDTRFDGGIAEVYCAPGQFIDLTVQANREKWRTAAGKPENLGAAGGTPTGTNPLVYLHLDDTEAPANFATNRAGNGNYTITGTLTTYANSPSD